MSVREMARSETAEPIVRPRKVIKIDDLKRD